MFAWSLYSVLAFFLVLRFGFIFASTVISFLYIHLIRPRLFEQKNLAEKYGKWAVVTGCSRGIGRSYAVELARKGMNIVLISQSKDLLQELSDDIEKSYNTKTLVIQSDMSLGEEEHLKIFKQLKDLDVGILVNNVGTANGLPNYIEKMTRNQVWNIIMLNIWTAASMTHYLLPQMKKKGRGLIINNSSATSYLLTPYGVLYGASKAFMTRFSDSLRAELEGTGVEVQTLCPVFVNTEMTASTQAQYQPPVLFPSPEKFVKSAVGTIGTSSITGYWSHDLQVAILDSVPIWFKQWVCSKYVDVEEIKAKKQSQSD